MKLLDLIKLMACAGFATAAGFVAAAAPVDVPDTMAERVKACVICHGTEDKVGRDGYYPRIAGKPEGYLFNQLRNFRDGQRYYRPYGPAACRCVGSISAGNGRLFFRA